ncbi:MAG TPA: aldo/keto reductase [Solirubrobacteraceae bacterium]
MFPLEALSIQQSAHSTSDPLGLGKGSHTVSHAYGKGDEQSGLETIHRALELGITLLDTAEVYGPHTNEQLVGRAIAGRRDEFEIATKFGFAIDPDRPSDRATDGRPENVRRACEGSLERLGTDHIDLFYQHRVDPHVPIEETVGAMAELVEQGKVRYLGLSEASAETIRRAHATHPLTAVQSEYSLWTRDVEDDVLGTLRELGIGLVAYSLLGRGITPAQLALAWVMAKGEDIVPIPGTKSPRRLEENAAAAETELSAQDVEELDNAISPEAVRGDRYPGEMMALLNN